VSAPGNKSQPPVTPAAQGGAKQPAQQTPEKPLQGDDDQAEPKEVEKLFTIG